MAWTSPMTAVAGELFTAAEFNTNIRDNFLETAPAIASNDGSMFVVDGANRIVERKPGSVVRTKEDDIRISQVRFTDLQSLGPLVTVKTGNRAIVSIACELMNRNTDAQASASFEVSGATNIPASDHWRITHDGITGRKWTRNSVTRRVTLNPGLNTFRMKYRTGNLGPVHFRRREIIVIPM